MSNNVLKIYPLEKIISILSYLTMGIVGVIWLIISYFLKKKLRFFLMYNVYQSMIIAISLAIINLIIGIILPILSVIPLLNYLAAIFNYIISIKIIRLYQLGGLSFTVLEFLVFLLVLYICIGVFIGRIFYIPWLTDFMNKIVKKNI